MAGGTLREPKSPVTVEEILSEELYGVALKARNEPAGLSPAAVQRSLIAAEDYLERRLQVRWRPTRVFSDARGRIKNVFGSGAHVLSLAPLDPPYDALADIDEPAYDYQKDFWTEEQWGWIDLTHRPVRDITQVVFAFPGTEPLYRVPETWLRLDRKFGRLQLVPAGSAAIYATFNSIFMSILSGARGVPQSIFIDYTTGYTVEEWVTHGQDLLQALRLLTTLNILSVGGIALAQGGTNSSLSLDGLSRSKGYMTGKFGPYSGRIEFAQAQYLDILANWQRREVGIPMVFV